MNQHDLLDAIGGIDPKYIEDADRPVSGKRKTVRFQRYYLAAAGLFLLIAAGVVIKNTQLIPNYESAQETANVTTLGGAPASNEEFAAESAEETQIQATGTAESIEGSPMQATGTAEAIEGSPIEAPGASENAGDSSLQTAAATDGLKASSEGEEVATKESAADYPAMVMYEGALYKDSGKEFTGEISEDATLETASYTDGEPSENRQQNFDRSSAVKFFVFDENTIVVCMDPDEGAWRIFLKQ